LQKLNPGLLQPYREIRYLEVLNDSQLSMKRTVQCALLILVMLSCRKNEALPELPGETSVISADKLSSVRTAGDPLTVKLTAVSDSRCPKNVVCVTAGVADLTFEVSNSQDQVDVQVVFSEIGKQSNSQEFSIGKRGYTLHVTEVLPYRTTSEKPGLDLYRITVTVE
jgi:hypothetical protein